MIHTHTEDTSDYRRVDPKRDPRKRKEDKTRKAQRAAKYAAQGRKG